VAWTERLYFTGCGIAPLRLWTGPMKIAPSRVALFSQLTIEKRGTPCAGLATLNSRLVGRLVSRSIARWLVDRPTDRVGRDRETPGNACNYRAIGSEFANRPRASINQNNSTRSFATTVIIRCLSTLAGHIASFAPGKRPFSSKNLFDEIIFLHIMRNVSVLDDIFSHKSTFIFF